MVKKMISRSLAELVCGYRRLRIESLEERRLLTVAGTLDTTFGVGGKATLSINDQQDIVRAIAIQPDGKILLAGGTKNASNGNENFALARFNADGSIDTTFGGGDGKVTTDMADDDYIYDVAVQPDGNIVVAGSAFDGDDSKFAIARYDGNGTLDPSFSGDGKTMLTVNDNTASARNLTLLDNGKILIAGNLQRANGYSDFALLRLNSNGSIDTSFHGDGWVLTPITSGDATDVGAAIVLQSNTIDHDNTNDKIVLGGFSGNLNNSDYDFAVVRYLNNGTLDDSSSTPFSDDGKKSVAITSRDDKAFGIALDLSTPSNPKIVQSGWTETSGELRASIVRYNNDGSLDTSLGTTGKITLTYEVGNIDNLSVQADGKILIASRKDSASDDNFAIIRLNTDGSFDTSFDGDGVAEVSFGNQEDVGYVVALDAQGRILVGGKAGEDFGVARFTNDLSARSLQGRVYVDSNRDGQFTAGEQPLAGVKLELHKTVTLGGDSEDRLVWETTTDTEGKYLFANLPPDSYEIREFTPDGYYDDVDYVGSLSGTLIASDTITNIMVNDQDVGIHYDFTENRPPVANAQSPTTTEDTALPITLTGSDLDNNPLTYVMDAPPLHGTLSGTLPHATYTPSANYFGPDSFTFVVYDGALISLAATVSINVTAVNDAPTLVANTGIMLPESQTVVLSSSHLSATDVDNAAAGLTFTVAGLPTHGSLQKNFVPLTLNGSFTQQDISDGKIRYVHTSANNGSDIFAFTLSDGNATIGASFPITILQAPPSGGSEFRVNTTTSGMQGEPDVAMDAEGDYVVVWSSISAASGYDIFAQRYNALGQPQGSEFQVNTYTTHHQSGASIAMDTDGDFVVVWNSYTQDGDAGGIYSQRFNSHGLAQGSEFRVSTFTTGYQQGVDVAMDADGDFAIAFQDVMEGVFVRRYNAQGIAQGSEFLVEAGPLSPDVPRIAMDDDGDFVVVWSSSHLDYRANAQRYDSQGVPVGTRLVMNSQTNGLQPQPDVAMDDSGNFLITWIAHYLGGENGVMARRYDAQGVVQGNTFQVDLDTISGQGWPKVSFDEDGDAVVTWNSYYQDGDSWGVYARKFYSGGGSSDEFRVNEHTQGYQVQSAVAAGPDDTFVIAWRSEGQDGDQDGVYARRYGPLPSLRVTSMTPTPTGFVVEFNRALNPAELNLYEQQEPQNNKIRLGTSDILLTGANTGIVSGSAVIDPSLRKLTFLQTNGLLPADDYTVVLKSGVQGFATPSGLLLDGDQNGVGGDDYLGNFTIAAPAGNSITLTALNFVRGFTQNVNLPSTSSTGYPILISNGQGVSGVDFDLRYNPQLLTITAVNLAPGINGAVTANNLTPGLLRVTVSSGTQLSAAAGKVPLANLVASVPNDSPYAMAHVLDLHNVHIYNSSAQPAELPSLDDDGMHIAALLGDASGNKDHDAPDALYTQQLNVAIESGLYAYPLADPYIMTDIWTGPIPEANDDRVKPQANDVSEIQRATVDLPSNYIPPDPVGAPLPPGGPDPIVSISQNLTASAGETISVPVELLVTESTGIDLAGVDLAIAYDATRLELDAVRIGQLLVGFGMNANLETPGVIKLSLAGSESLALPFESSGVLANLEFKVLGGDGPTRLNLLHHADSMYTALYDDLGQTLLLQPAPTNADDDSVDGLIEILAVDQAGQL